MENQLEMACPQLQILEDTLQETEKKPYDMCLECPHLGVRCDGPNLIVMEMPRLVEWATGLKKRRRKENPKFTNELIAEKAGVSKSIVDQFLTGKSADIRKSTVSGIMQALIGTWGQFPCPLAGVGHDYDEVLERAHSAEAEVERLKSQLEQLNDETTRNTSFLVDTKNFYEHQLQEKDKLLKERADFLRLKDRAIWLLSVGIFVSVAALIAVLILSRLGIF